MNNLNHVAVIMDGNGRWGLKKRGSRNYGHSEGLKTVESVIRLSIHEKIPYLTLYTFSTENWKRPAQEVNFLFNLIRKSIKKKLKKVIKQGIKVNIIGERKGLPKDIVTIVKLIERKTRHNKIISLNLALNYGSKSEIINAVKLINKNEKTFTEKNIEGHLYTKNIPNPDILIRTGGEFRLSNFLLWQSAYSEYEFVRCNWPDFNKKRYVNALKNYENRERRFGNLNE